MDDPNKSAFTKLHADKEAIEQEFGEPLEWQELPGRKASRIAIFAFPAPARPRLIASQRDPVGSVAVIMADILEPGRGKVEIADVFAAYAEACEASGKRPIPANEFPAAIAELCQPLRIEIEDNEKGVFLMRIKLNKSAPKLRLST